MSERKTQSAVVAIDCPNCGIPPETRQWHTYCPKCGMESEFGETPDDCETNWNKLIAAIGDKP